MIFSLSETSTSQEVREILGTDIFCFFKTPHAIKVPLDVFWLSVFSSLKLKKNVLILEAPLVQMPSLGPARWNVGEQFLYLAPRATSVLFEATLENSMTYPSVKAHLTTFK